MPELADIDPEAARDLVEAELMRSVEGCDLSGAALTELLRLYGVNLWPTEPAATADAAAEAADRLGYPVVLKASAPHLMHRTDLGGVRLELGSESAVRRAYEQFLDTFGPQIADELVVQRMAGRGVACVVETSEDALFGPVVSFGIGGVVTELVEDRGYRIPPLSDLDAAALVRSPKAAPLLFGYRGAETMDVAALEDLLLRVSRLADDLPELARLELNPVLATPSGVAVLSGCARLAPPVARRDPGVRRLG